MFVWRARRWRQIWSAGTVEDDEERLMLTVAEKPVERGFPSAEFMIDHGVLSGHAGEEFERGGVASSHANTDALFRPLAVPHPLLTKNCKKMKPSSSGKDTAAQSAEGRQELPTVEWELGWVGVWWRDTGECCSNFQGQPGRTPASTGREGRRGPKHGRRHHTKEFIGGANPGPLTALSSAPAPSGV